MALHANIYWEVRTTGQDANGGGFKTGATGTDRSQQDSPQLTLTTASVVHTTTTQLNVSAGDGTVSAADVGNLVQLAGGTATAGFYEITAVDVPNNRWTVDRVLGTSGQTCVGRMGGALASLGQVGSAPVVNGQRVYIKAGTYLVTTATFNVSNGCFAPTTQVQIEGYQTTRGDLGTKPLIQASGAITGFTLIRMQGNLPCRMTNLKLDGASKVGASGLNFRGFVSRIEAVNFTSNAFQTDVAGLAYCLQCSASGCSNSLCFSVVSCWNCVAFGNTITGFGTTSNTVFFVNCLSYNNTGAFTDGFSTGASIKSFLLNCTAYGNGRDGFRISSDFGINLINCVAEANAGVGFSVQGGAPSVILEHCAGFNNTGGNVSLGAGVNNQNLSFITGSSSFFVNAGAGNFALNTTAGGGATLRGTGLPGVFPGGLTTGFLDLGAVQHQDAGGGSTAGAVAYVG